MHMNNTYDNDGYFMNACLSFSVRLFGRDEIIDLEHFCLSFCNRPEIMLKDH